MINALRHLIVFLIIVILLYSCIYPNKENENEYRKQKNFLRRVKIAKWEYGQKYDLDKYILQDKLLIGQKKTSLDLIRVADNKKLLSVSGTYMEGMLFPDKKLPLRDQLHFEKAYNRMRDIIVVSNLEMVSPYFTRNFYYFRILNDDVLFLDGWEVFEKMKNANDQEIYGYYLWAKDINGDAELEFIFLNKGLYPNETIIYPYDTAFEKTKFYIYTSNNGNNYCINPQTLDRSRIIVVQFVDGEWIYNKELSDDYRNRLD